MLLSHYINLKIILEFRLIKMNYIDYLKENTDVSHDFITYFGDVLKYTKNVFIINFDDIYTLFESNRRIVKNKFMKLKFEENIDYIISKINNNNSEILYITVDCFKKFCIKLDAIRYYSNFCKLEENYQKMLLCQKDLDIDELKYSIREEVLLESFRDKKVMYIGLVDPNIAKFGYTDNLLTRVKAHRSDYS